MNIIAILFEYIATALLIGIAVLALWFVGEVLYATTLWILYRFGRRDHYPGRHKRRHHTRRWR